MLVTIPKWKVVVTMPSGVSTFWIYDNSLSNVIRKVADMQFAPNGLEQPSSVVFSGEAEQEGVFIQDAENGQQGHP